MSKHLLLAGTICLAVLVAGCLFAVLPVYGQQGDTQVPVPSLDVLILVDESETMWNYTDPEDKRVRAVNLFIDELSTLVHRGDKHRVGIIAFGTEPKVIPWTFLDSKADADKIKQEYQATHDAFGKSGYTDINKALAKALEIMQVEHDDPSRKPALILISDGQPTRRSPPVNEKQRGVVNKEPGGAVVEYLQKTQQIVDEFKAVSYTGSLCPAGRGTPLFVLAVGTDVLLGTYKSTPEFVSLYENSWWTMADSTGGYYEKVDSLDKVGSAVTEVFGRLACGVVYKDEDVQELQFIVAEEYFQTFFIISGKDNPAIKVFRPGQNKSIQPGDEDVKWRKDVGYEVWSVERSEPWAGTWQVVPEGEGRACFSYILFSPFSIEVQQPPHEATLPVGKPIRIKARVVHKSKQSQVPVRAQDVEVLIKPPYDPEKEFSLEEHDGIYWGQFNDTNQPGEYQLEFEATLQDGITKVYELTKVKLVSKPWLECLKPAEGSAHKSDEPILLDARIYLAGGAFSKDDVEVKAELSRDGEIDEETLMACQKTDQSNVLTCDGRFQAGHDPGAYKVNMVLESILTPGRLVHESSTVNIVILSPPTTTPTPTPTPSPTETLTPTPSPVPQTPTATSTPSPTETLTPAPSPVPPTPTAIETPTTIPTPLPTATPTNTPAPLPTPTPTATPTLPEVLAVAALSNPLQCLLCVGAALILFLLCMMLRKLRPEPETEPSPSPHPIIEEFREFIAFLTSLWGILATSISVSFPLFNALLKVIPLGACEQGSGGLVHFSPQSVTVVTMVTTLFTILYTFSQRRQFKRQKNRLRRHALYSFACGLLTMMVYLVVNFFVMVGCRIMEWSANNPLLLVSDVVLMLSYNAFFALITRAFVLLGVGFFEEKSNSTH